LSIFGHLQVLLEGGQGLRGERLDIGIGAVVGLSLKFGDIFAMV
jgi:hypothetical protein